jgi:hypothetical protein
MPEFAKAGNHRFHAMSKHIHMNSCGHASREDRKKDNEIHAPSDAAGEALKIQLTI